MTASPDIENPHAGALDRVLSTAFDFLERYGALPIVAFWYCEIAYAALGLVRFLVHARPR